MPRRLTRHDPANLERAEKRFELVMPQSEYDAIAAAAVEDKRSIAMFLRIAAAEKLARLGRQSYRPEAPAAKAAKRKSARPSKKK